MRRVNVSSGPFRSTTTRSTLIINWAVSRDSRNDSPTRLRTSSRLSREIRRHSQHEIWREVGATYLAADQFEDARDALERFLENRPSDPEALYLMGRAHAGLGHRREAASSMQACIEAVKTAPAYKYRADKRWLNEAQQFIKSSQ